MPNTIFSTFWGDSASYISSLSHIVPESPTTAIAYILRDYFSGAFIFNLQILLGFIMTFAISYYVGNKVFRNKFAAIFLAILLTFAPLRIRYSMEWAVLAFWGYYLFFLYGTFNYLKNNNKMLLLLGGASFSLAFLEQPYLGIILGIVGGASGLLFSLFHPNKEYFKRFLIFCLALIIFGIPGVTSVYRQRYINERFTDVNFSMAVRSESNRWAYSARPWNYVIPDINNPYLGNSAVKANYWVWNQKPYYLTEPFFPKEQTLYLGFTLIALSITTLYLTFIKKNEFFVKYRDQTLFFLVAAIIAFIFSMPPYIAYNNIYFYFPGQILYSVIPQFRSYARFGAIVFIGIAMLSTTYFTYLLSTRSKLWQLILISGLIFIEFSTPFFSNRISDEPTSPYLWLSQQPGDFSYLEIPRRIDYTDVLYKNAHNKKILNAYLQTPESVAEIERSITQDTGNSAELICNRFVRELNGKYIMYHDKELYKDTIVEKFIESEEVTPELKIAMEESWGEPIWGNHVPKSEEDLAKIEERKNLLDKLKNDSRFRVAKEFNRGEIDSDPAFNANDLDQITVLEINPNYCN